MDIVFTNIFLDKKAILSQVLVSKILDCTKNLKLKKIMEDRNNERRFTERFRIPDGMIYLRKLRKINWLNNFHGPFALNDIASNSVSFECMQDIGIKRLVELKISSPHSEKEVTVKGQIIRRSDVKDTGEYLYVVQFNPFGEGHQYNKHMSRDEMREFIRTVQMNGNF